MQMSYELPENDIWTTSGDMTQHLTSSINTHELF
jgi:hypothetical protein